MPQHRDGVLLAEVVRGRHPAAATFDPDCTLLATPIPRVAEAKAAGHRPDSAHVLMPQTATGTPQRP